MNKIEYLKRINYTQSLNINDNVLAELHKNHIYQIPFENLDVYFKRIFDLDIEKVYKKIITDKRGGFCYELNLLFNWLLTEIGFSSRIIAARIFNEDGTLGPAFDHMSVYVKTEKEFLVDVGYGDLFVTPIEIKTGEQYDGRNYFKIEEWNHQEYLISMSTDGIEYLRRYIFSLAFVEPNDFSSICLDKQINPESYFVKNVICTKPTDTGRLTIFNEKFIEKKDKSRTESLIHGEDSLKMYLKNKFQILLK